MGTLPLLRTWGKRRRILLGAFALCALIVVITACSYGNFTRFFRQAALNGAYERASVALEKDVVMRSWAAASGGVYVPETEKAPLNPYLPPAMRGITAEDGRRFTRLNPAYLTRQLQEEWSQSGHLPARITSLRPLRPENKPDEWETHALLELARTNGNEFIGEVEQDGKRVLRLMRPLRMEENCVNCHGIQGYKPGDLRGGLSIAMPVSGTGLLGARRGILFAHLAFAFSCLALLVWATRKLLARSRERDAVETDLRNLAATLEQRVAERTRQAEESEKRSRRILSSTSDGLIGLDVEGTITFVNQAALAMLGYPGEDELLGKDLHATAHSRNYDGSSHTAANCPLCEARRKAYSVKFQDEVFRRRDGSFVLISGSMAPMMEGPRVIGAIMAFQDVSELRQSAMLHQAMFDNSGEPFFFWDEQRRLQECNAAAVALVGAGSRRDLVDHVEDFRLECQENGELSLDRMEAVFDRCEREGSTRLLWTLRHADGSLIPCDVNVVRVASGSFSGYFASLHDLRPVRESERRLESGHKLLLDMIKACPASMVIHDDDLCVRLCNPAAHQLLKVEEGNFLDSIWVRPDERENAAAEARAGGLVMRRPMQVYEPSGEVLDTLVGMTPVEYDGEGCMLVWLQNVTSLVAARREAEASNRAKSDFLAQMSHEIRTPMNAIMGMTHLLLQTELASKQQHYVHRARQAARTLLGLLNDILDFSKIEAGRMTLESAPFRLGDVLKNMADLLMFLAEEKKLELLVNVDADVPDQLMGDALRLSQVLINLTNNALKFTSVGQVVVRCRLAERSADEVCLRFEVSDTGIGMSQRQKDRLFQPFRQGDESIARQYGGTGLGLVICERLVRLMGGSLWVRSEEGKGSCFGFTVRLRPSFAPESETVAGFAGERVLVADDNPEAREILCAMTAELGCRVDAASSGVEAVNAVASAVAAGDPYRLALLDWSMPDMDGLACAAALNRAAGAADKPALVMVSACGVETYRLRGSEAGFQAYLAKPVLKADLERVLAGALRLELPAATMERKEEAEEEADGVAAFCGERVLLVEDDELGLEVAIGMLESFGLDVRAVTSGEEAVRVCGEESFALVFMDVQMPGMDGREAVRRIRTMPGHSAYEFPIVALTAFAMASDRDKNLQAGMNEHLAKPLVPEALRDVLLRWLRPQAGAETAAPCPTRN